MISNTVPTIHSPRSLHEALLLCLEIPHKQLQAGATAGRNISSSRFIEMDKTIISLDRVQELKRINITDRYIEIGSTLTLNQLLKIREPILPEILREAILSTGSHSIRNLATLGGNICVSEARMDLFAVLHLLDARLELLCMKKKRRKRKTRQVRHIPINMFLTDQFALNLGSDEILTKIRIPNNSFDFIYFNKLDTQYYSDSIFSLTHVSQIQRNLISDFRIAVNNRSLNIFRDREFESELLGRRLPLSDKEITLTAEIFSRKLSVWLNDENHLFILSLKHMFIYIMEKLNEQMALSI